MPQLLQDFSEVSSKVTSSKASSRSYLPLGYTKSSPKSGPCPVCGTCAWEVGNSAVFCKGTNESDIYIDNFDGTEWVALRESNSWSGFKAYKLSEKFGASTKTRAERDAEIAHNAAQQAKEAALRIASLPSLELRNAHYQANLRPLESVDIADLIKRGLTAEEIANAERLGAIGRGPSQTRKSGRDYLILSQVRKLIVGGQVASSGKVKYYWDNTFQTHLPVTDCNPHFEFSALRSTTINSKTLVVVVEGFLKALVLQILADREGLDWIVLGYAGGGGVNANLAIAIKGYQERYGCRFVLCPDADVHLNPNVKTAVARSLSAASYDGILWFGQTIKGINIDDVDAATRASAKIISTSEYWMRIQDLVTDRQEQEVGREIAKVAAEMVTTKKGQAKAAKLIESLKATKDITKYKAGDTKEAAKAWFGANTNIVLDRTPTGGGKSYTAAKVMEQLKLEGLYTVMVSTRYLRDDAINNIVKVYGRHMGHALVEDAVRTVKLSDNKEQLEIVTESNCFKAGQITKQIQAGLYAGDDNSVFQNDCLGCPLFKQCQNGAGVTDGGRAYGYLHQRNKLGKELAVALHPQSLPGHDTELYHAKFLFVFDEWDSLRDRLVDVQVLTTTNLKELLATLRRGGMDLSIFDILDKASQVGVDSRFGANHGDLIEILKEIDVASLDEIEEHLKQEQMEQSKLSNREDFSGSSSQRDAAWQKQLDKLIPEFISNLRQVIAGTGTVKVNSVGDLTFTCPSQLSLVIRNMNMVILDATTSKDEIEAYFGGAEITEVMSDMETKDAKIVKVSGAKFTRNRTQGMRDTAVAAAEALVYAHARKGQKVGIIDALYFMRDYEGVDAIKMGAFSESRGSNKAAHAHALVIVGTIRPNMTEVRDTYDRLVQTGLELEWEDFYKMKCNEEMIQGFGRLRSNRRHNEDLTIYILDGSYDGHYDAEITVEQLITEKATGKAKKIWLIAQALKAIGSNGADGKTTLRELEAATGISHSHVNSLLPFAATLLSSLSLDELLDSLHGYGVSEEAIITIINEAILSASGADQDCVTEWSYEVEDECDDF